MKTSALCLLASLIFFQSHSQSASSSPYMEASYMKVKNGDYLTLEKEIWKPIHEKLIEDGKKTGWFLYKMKYPVGTDTKYDYITISTYGDWNQFEDPWGDVKAIFDLVHPDKDIAEILAKGDGSRDMVWRQLFSLSDVAKPEGTFSKYLIMNEVQTVSGEEGNYINLEKTYFKPFHVERIEAGIMAQWAVYKRNMPYGDQFSSNYVTINGYDEWEDITKQNPQGIWKKVHGDTDFNKIHDDILSKRMTINNEMWVLIDFAVKGE